MDQVIADALAKADQEIFLIFHIGVFLQVDRMHGHFCFLLFAMNYTSTAYNNKNNKL